MNLLLEKFAELYRQGGFVMPPLVICALLLWYALGYRLLALRRGSRAPLAKLVEQLRQAPPRRTGGVVVSAVSRAWQEAALWRTNLRQRLDDALYRQEREMDRFRVLANSIVVVAPLAGLLGTVSGMIETFDSLGDMTLFSQSGGVAGGIAEALVSTQVGLGVAIPGLLVGRMLNRKQERLTAELEELKNILCARAIP